MDLGHFSVSLNVKDIVKSKVFYENLGFKAHEGCGSVEDKWLIMQSGAAIIGLFEGMIDNNMLTFNPQDARAIQAQAQAQGIAIDNPVESGSGPCHFFITDPDGNKLMFDQF